jgi:hypothetical protein
MKSVIPLAEVGAKLLFRFQILAPRAQRGGPIHYHQLIVLPTGPGIPRGRTSLAQTPPLLSPAYMERASQHSGLLEIKGRQSFRLVGTHLKMRAI